MVSLPVSCLITSYNNLSTLPRAIESVLNQSEKFSEIIIADDGSSDGSREFIKYFAEKNSLIKPLYNSSNLGPSGNRDNAIRVSSCPFFTQLDGDDYFCRHKLKNEWNALGGSENKIAFSRILLINELNPLKCSARNPSAHGIFATDKYFEFLLTRSVHEPRDMLMSKKLYEAVGGYNFELNVYEDWDLKLRLAASNAEWVFAHGFGTVYMQHNSGLSELSTIHDIQKIIAMYEDLILKKTGKDYQYFQELYNKPRSKSESYLLRSSLFDKYKALRPFVKHLVAKRLR